MSLFEIKRDIETHFSTYQDNVFFKDATITKGLSSYVLVHINPLENDICLDNKYQVNAKIRVFIYKENDAKCFGEVDNILNFLQFKLINKTRVSKAVTQSGSIQMGGLRELVVDFTCSYG